MLAGYLHPAYARSFSDAGRPLRLPLSGANLLARPISDTAHEDAVNCYPLLCCERWAALADDLSSIPTPLVSIVAVTDPLGAYEQELLARTFDFANPFKEHFVIRTGAPPETFVRSSHRHHARRALRTVDVEICQQPLAYLDEWQRLYGVLCERHHIPVNRRLASSAVEAQFLVPGFVMFRACYHGRTVGLDLWFEQGAAAQGHLAAFDAVGYRLQASYATKWTAIEHFTPRVEWINLGGVPSDGGDGLTHFKAGWATGTRWAWLCGRIVRHDIFDALVRRTRPVNIGYFPAYRALDP